MGLTFSGTTPLISVFCWLFFYLKYYIDKYNLTFVYNREFEGRGVIKKQVLPFMLLSIYIFQLLNMGYFTIFHHNYFKGSLIYITFQSIGLIFLLEYYRGKKRLAKQSLAKLELAY